MLYALQPRDLLGLDGNDVVLDFDPTSGCAGVQAPGPIPTLAELDATVDIFDGGVGGVLIIASPAAARCSCRRGRGRRGGGHRPGDHLADLVARGWDIGFA